MDSRGDGPLAPGLEATVEAVVDESMLADRVGSGPVRVLATPIVVALVERAAVAAMAPALPEGTISVGTRIDLAHVAPTPAGGTVVATARVEGVERRRVSFNVTVRDEAGEVARGTHDRAIVVRERFERAAAGRRSGA